MLATDSSVLILGKVLNSSGPLAGGSWISFGVDRSGRSGVPPCLATEHPGRAGCLQGALGPLWNGEDLLCRPHSLYWWPYCCLGLADTDASMQGLVTRNMLLEIC